ncbi:MAG: toll/interleukin-1 receptor domain-containing protein [Thiolinea sp.]
MPEADAPMKKAFISYRRQDSAGYVRAMHDRLIRHFSPEQIFMDVDDIALGTDFVQELNENLQGCTVMLVVIGPQWTDIRNSRGERRLEHPQDFVRQEVAEALQRQLTVIPVLVNGAAMPSELELPEELQPLSRRQALELDNKYYESGMRELIAALERYLGKPEPSPLAAACLPHRSRPIPATCFSPATLVALAARGTGYHGCCRSRCVLAAKPSRAARSRTTTRSTGCYRPTALPARPIRSSRLPVLIAGAGAQRYGRCDLQQPLHPAG